MSAGRKKSDRGPIEPFAFSVRQFCEAHGISVAFFYHLRAIGEGPQIMRVGSRVLISREAAERWRRGRERGGV